MMFLHSIKINYTNTYKNKQLYKHILKRENLPKIIKFLSHVQQIYNFHDINEFTCLINK